MTEGVNPYQPVMTPENSVVADVDGDVHFAASQSQLRFAESQYLLRQHSFRLFFGSLAMIACSMIAIALILWRFPNPFSFVAALIGTMVVSSGLYLAMVHKAKMKIREQLRTHGLVQDYQCTIRLDPDQVVLTSPLGVYAWRNAKVKVYRTRKGVLLCPEPFLFVFVPKTSNFIDASYNEFRKRLFNR
ncbi:membrane protein [Rhodopirellula maiorica SM1]|uniref:Membrane protein n=1 Tax=Rhodopirellula maiorica SM1 TaxID=1265738 RepID=M5RU60_9BACT|nr:hypothetical protein [Rhodopirellula maiorica]EMI22736.1 membrane protein [Rhodopirellula maiorica SM1]